MNTPEIWRARLHLAFALLGDEESKREVVQAICAAETAILALSPEKIDKDCCEPLDAATLLAHVAWSELSASPRREATRQEDLTHLLAVMSKADYQPSTRWPFSKQTMCQNIPEFDSSEAPFLTEVKFPLFPSI